MRQPSPPKWSPRPHSPTQSEFRGQQRRAAAPLLAAAGAELGALTGAVVGLFAGWGVGMAIGLPRYQLGNDPEGFDDLGAALVGLVFGWLLGSLLGFRLATRRRPRPGLRVEACALAAMAVLAVGATVVGSAAADWYYPLVLFGAPAVAMATATAMGTR